MTDTFVREYGDASFTGGVLTILKQYTYLTPDEAVNLASALLQWASSVRPFAPLVPMLDEAAQVPAQEEAEDA